MKSKKIKSLQKFISNHCFNYLLFGVWMGEEKNMQLVLKSVIKQILIYGGGFISSFIISEYLFPYF